MGKRTKIKPCFWCGSLDNENNHVTISEDVPPRWLSGITKVKEKNCVPQCEKCKKDLALLDNAVSDYFRYGAGVHLDKVEHSNLLSKNKSFVSRKIILNGNTDYVQANGCLFLWLRKLLSGLWYKENNNRFNGLMLILAPWLSFNEDYFFICNKVIPSNFSYNLLLDIDEYIGYIHIIDDINKVPFKYTFIQSSKKLSIISPLQLLRFAIYENFCGYCLFIPDKIIGNTSILSNYFDKPPLYIYSWLKSSYCDSSFIVNLTNSLKLNTTEEVTKRVRL